MRLAALLRLRSSARLNDTMLVCRLLALAKREFALHLQFAWISRLMLLLAAVALQHRDCRHAGLLRRPIVLHLAWSVIQLFLRLEDWRQV